MVITINVLLEICAGISAVGLALGYLIKAVKAVKKPTTDINDKLKKYDEMFENDNERLDNLERMMIDMKECMGLLLESEMATLGHLEDGNHTKMLSEKKKKIEDYLYRQVVDGGIK